MTTIITIFATVATAAIVMVMMEATVVMMEAKDKKQGFKWGHWR